MNIIYLQTALFAAIAILAIVVLHYVKQTCKLVQYDKKIDAFYLQNSGLSYFRLSEKSHSDIPVLCSNDDEHYMLLSSLGYEMIGYDGSEAKKVGATAIEKGRACFILDGRNVSKRKMQLYADRQFFIDDDCIIINTCKTLGLALAIRMTNANGSAKECFKSELEKMVDIIKNNDVVL